ncbi:DNA recombination protein RmuC [Roseospira visakhapatnamensis]|uniref:DNA recombination protein RmuC homolog n=1 Tax=Roseospira visakhapatnamensis TaxID=390880 RepID=A0A7W6RH45_9PROT|nr:DNA recombination protein RmuC [Roseospira visakhapatnamensis]MBB4267929.1 DNA recombination protein RmuC [Roseospira visakhapatnamensis]
MPAGALSLLDGPGWTITATLLAPPLVVALVATLVARAMLRARSLAFARERALWRAQADDHRARLLAAADDADQARDRYHEAAADLAAARAGLALRDRQVEDLTAAVRAADDRLEALRDDRDTARRDLSALSATLEQERRAAADRLALARETGETMTARFKALADEALVRQGEALGRRHQDHLDALLRPFREQLEGFQGRVNAVHADNQRATGALDAQLKSLMDLNQTIGREATGLARVLRGGGRAQGAWGEMVLDRILDQSGLRRGHDYQTQVSAETPDGRRRPDVIVRLPRDRAVVIDSKVSLTAFDRHCSVTEARSDAQAARAAALKDHLRSLRAHIDDLGRKDYHKIVGDGLDVVLMFVPVEGALALALDADPALIERALDRRVILCAPTTLTLALRTVAHLWRMDRRAQGTARLAHEAEALYERFAAFAEDLMRVGEALDTARTAHDAAVNTLSRGRGNVVRRLERLRTDGGLAPGRAIPAPLVERTDDDASADNDTPLQAAPPAPRPNAASCPPARVGLE